MATRVLVCDALPVVREGMRTVLAAEPDIEVVGTTDSGIEAMATAVRVVAAGEAMLAPCVSRKLLDWFFERAARPNGQVNLAVAGLSPREREVLGLVARGMSGLEIAKELQITEATVRTHIYRIRHKLELRNRAQLVAFAYRFGLAPAA